MKAVPLRSLSLLALAALSAFAPLASAGTLFVDANLVTGAADGSSWANAFQGSGGLQDALGVAVSGDDVFVADGEYLPTSTGSRGAAFALINGSHSMDRSPAAKPGSTSAHPSAPRTAC